MQIARLIFPLLLQLNGNALSPPNALQAPPVDSQPAVSFNKTWNESGDAQLRVEHPSGSMALPEYRELMRLEMERHPLLSFDGFAHDGMVRVLVHLGFQPASRIIRSQLESENRIRSLRDAIRQENLASVPALDGPVEYRDDEVRIRRGTPPTATAVSLQEELDRELAGFRETARALLVEEVSPLQDLVAREVELLGGTVNARIPWINAIAATLPVDAVPVLFRVPEVAMIEPDGISHRSLDVAQDAMGTATFWTGGFDGGTWDVGIMDTGVDDTHPALSNVIHGVFLATAGNPSQDNTSDDVNGHGTHVAGISASGDSTYKGVAFGLDKVFNMKAGFDLDGSSGGSASMYHSDGMDGVDWAITYPGDSADVLNLSFGGSTGSDDNSYARFWDGVVSDMGVPAAISAGNSGPGAQTILSPSLAYNVLCVANMDDGGTSTRADDTIRSSSSRGPTVGGRRKPDIAAPGTSIRSCNNDWEGATADFVSKTGTSMAAPQVAGAMVLLSHAVSNDPLEIKALLLNTAEDRGDSGWDADYGWGYIDLDHAYTHRTDVFLDSISPQPEYKLYAGAAFANDTATLVWHRRVTYDNDSYPSVYHSLSDLDLFLYDESDGTLLASDTTVVDNVQQVTAPGAGTVVIKVDAASSSFAGSATEDFALATEESFVQVTPGDFSVTLVAPASVAPSASFTLTAQVANTTGASLHSVTVTVDLPPGFAITSGAHPRDLGTVSSGVTEDVDWTVQVSGGTGGFSLQTDASSSSYGESFDSQDSGSMGVLAGADGIGLYNAGGKSFFLKNSLGSGVADTAFRYGGLNKLPITGDWNGDGVDTIGVYRPASGSFFLRNSNSHGPAEVSFEFGSPGLVPIVGDWNGDGTDTVGVYDPATAMFYLRNSNDAGAPDLSFKYGGSNKEPVVGDWNGDGIDTIGIYSGAGGAFFLRNGNGSGVADIAFSFGPLNTEPIAGDWDNDGSDSIGLYVPASKHFKLKNDNSTGPPDHDFKFGGAVHTPLVGNWDGL